jgi:hypothetical protein
MSESAELPAAIGSVLVFRPISVERRAPAIAGAALAAVAILLGILAVVRHDGAGNFTVYAIAVGCVALILLCIALGTRRFVTECRPEGIRTRRWRAHQCAWSEVADIKRRSVSGRGTTSYTVVVSTKAGGRFTLGVPNAASTYRNPLFDQQLAQISDYWRAST